MKLDKRSTQPLYAQLKELLIERIQHGTSINLVSKYHRNWLFAKNWT